MSGDSKGSIPHSIFQKLLNLARLQHVDMNLLLTRYAMERYLYRLSISPYSNCFIMKGASLFLVWKGRSYRVTRDADMLVTGGQDPDQLDQIFAKICTVACSEDDGMRYISDTVRATSIREDQAYEGVRITLLSKLYHAKINLQIDLGFGDALTPAAERIIYPVLLDGPAPRLRAYPRYSVISEKLETMVRLGIVNSRMKDFYDILLLSRLFKFDGEILRQAIRNTFHRRRTPMPDSVPLGLTEIFFQDVQKQTQWKAFVRKTKPTDATEDIEDTVTELRRFLLPVLKHLQDEEPIDIGWSPEEGWQ